MAKKFVAMFTVFCFLASSWSCVLKKDVTILPKDVAKEKNISDILAVLLTSGEEIEFHKSGLGRLVGDEIVGSSGKLKIVEYPKTSKFGAFKYPVGKVIRMEDNWEFVILRKVPAKSGMVAYELIPQVHFPLVEIEQMYLKKKIEVASGIASILCVGVLLVAVIAALKESCPFIYSYDGTNYIFDAEPYGGATCPGLQRTEWVKLENLKEVDGFYRIRLTNEVDETQYTDELKLVVFDHQPGATIAPEENGVIHTFSSPQPPTRAVDGRGRDILRYVAKTDWISWQTGRDDLADITGPTTKGELLFEFAMPAEAGSVKILFNGCNTLWGSQMVKRYLELYGENVSNYYAAINGRGWAYELLNNWNLNEELYKLQIRIETKNGWETRGAFVGGGPFISENKAYVVDLTGVEGDVLRIRLTPPAMFWAINSIAVNYEDDQQVSAQDLEAIEAMDASGTDIRAALNKTDQVYYAMPKNGDRAELTFKAPVLKPGRERTVMAKVSGYYDIHLDAQGGTRMDVLGRLQNEPGFAGRYGLDEYLKWKKELEAKKLNK